MEAHAGEAGLVELVKVVGNLGFGVLDGRGRCAFGGIVVGEVDVHAGYPCRAEFALGRRRQHGYSGKNETQCRCNEFFSHGNLS